MIVARIEGGLTLERSADRIVLPGAPTRGIENRLLGRSPMDAIYLTQQVSAGNGVAHALAAAKAWEAVGALPVAPNGELLRELLNLLALLHHHVQHFYFESLPDYLPLPAWGEYDGPSGEVARIAQGMARRFRLARAPEGARIRLPPAPRRRLTEHAVEAARTLAVLQRALARLGGKFPIVMSVAPGGMTAPFGEAAIVELDGYLAGVERFLTEAVLEDGFTLLEHHPDLIALGKGPPNFLCVGGGARLTEMGGELFPAGVMLGRRLQAPHLPVTESIRSAYYRVPHGPRNPKVVLERAPDKPGAYSWIKAPRMGESVVETGPIARLTIVQLTGVHGRSAGMAELVQEQLGVPTSEGNTVAGRMLARLGEIDLAFRRCREILRGYETGQPPLDNSRDPFSLSGEGVGAVEGPAGAVRHRMALERGRIAYYDIIAASTWNGSSRDEAGAEGPIEIALSQRAWDFQDAEQALSVSRIIRSFAFSTADAVH
jgi:Ni,Fe-hydrogenase I large subunit